MQAGAICALLLTHHASQTQRSTERGSAERSQSLPHASRQRNALASTKATVFLESMMA